MGARIAKGADPLLAGFFTLKDAARLLQIDNTNRIRAWLTGWNNSVSGPVIDRDFEGRTVSFLDLMEIRFVDHFRRQKVPMPTIRRAAQQLRNEWKTKHPLAYSNSDKYLTDRRKIFAQAAESEGDKATWDLATNQYEMWVAIESIVAKNVAFNPATEIAQTWHPLGNEFPNVIVDPRLAFGQPVIGKRPTPTSTLLRQWKAEGGNVERVAKWFRVEPNDVNEAVEFELSLAA
ncbi:DUF433 domain-containing protein [Mesorhizobium sp. B2-7-1]|uniref:DUF433 domain-containing protein n=1 Tax=Mesorhizobium sp. B2-7-1 TaxID=2589909 RepID=UPI00112D06BF|nr:DUF433 domain-containing protein [Mesorhizobium sp. B2-7-1]TPJ53222.1 DUF433 domain-containing protein [Mesorhizobium sp. B2-7-1]